VAYSVSLAPAADRQFRKLSVLIQQRIKPHIDALASDPRPAKVIKMEGESDLHRIRVGDYRVVYYLWDREGEMLVVKTAHRREVYR
jgi:mRNA interferase RelE/StbE